MGIISICSAVGKSTPLSKLVGVTNFASLLPTQYTTELRTPELGNIHSIAVRHCCTVSRNELKELWQIRLCQELTAHCEWWRRTTHVNTSSYESKCVSINIIRTLVFIVLAEWNQSQTLCYKKLYVKMGSNFLWSSFIIFQALLKCRKITNLNMTIHLVQIW